MRFTGRVWVDGFTIQKHITTCSGAFPCKRVGMSVIGLEVPHAHLHLIPLNTMDDINFTRKKLTVTREELLEAQQKIVHYLTGRDKR